MCVWGGGIGDHQQERGSLGSVCVGRGREGITGKCVCLEVGGRETGNHQQRGDHWELYVCLEGEGDHLQVKESLPGLDADLHHLHVSRTWKKGGKG
jgi:hypothetical protein